MTKSEFLTALGARLSALSPEDKQRSLDYYGEMIDDRIEDGVAEEEAVAAIGAIDDIVSEIVAEMPIAKLVKQKLKPKRAFRVWEIVLLALGSPVWISLLIAAVAVVLAVYVALWAVVVSLCCIPVCFAVCAPVGVLMSVKLAANGSVGGGIFIFGASLALAGLAIFAYFACRYLVKGLLYLTKKAWIGVKYSFIKQEESNGKVD